MSFRSVLGLSALIAAFAPSEAFAQTTMEWLILSFDGGCASSAGEYKGGLLDVDVCFDPPAPIRPGSIDVIGTLTKGDSFGKLPVPDVEFQASASVYVASKANGLGWITIDSLHVVATVDGWSYEVPLDLTKSLLESDDVLDLAQQFVGAATDIADRFNPKTASQIEGSPFPSISGLSLVDTFPQGFDLTSSKLGFEGTLELCVCDLAEMRVDGTWSDGREVHVVAPVTVDRETGVVYLGNKEWNDDWLAPSVHGKDIDEAATRFVRIVLARSMNGQR